MTSPIGLSFQPLVVISGSKSLTVGSALQWPAAGGVPPPALAAAEAPRRDLSPPPPCAPAAALPLPAPDPAPPPASAMRSHRYSSRNGFMSGSPRKVRAA